MFFLITGSVLLATFGINKITFVEKGVRQSKTIETTILTSVVFLGTFLLVDYFFLSGEWWSLNNEYILPTLVIAIGVSVVNIFLYSWFSSGSDYKPLEEAGVISDGCPYTGAWSIPQNFLTHASQVLWEEILFRGLIGLTLYFAFGILPAVIIPSLLFALFHYLPFRAFALKNNIKPDRYVLGAFISTGFFPALFMIFTIQFHSLIPAWIMHTFLNCSVGLYLRYILPFMKRKNYAH